MDAMNADGDFTDGPSGEEGQPTLDEARDPLGPIVGWCWAGFSSWGWPDAHRGHPCPSQAQTRVRSKDVVGMRPK